MSSQARLFEPEELSDHLQEWKGMPEYNHEDLTPKRQIIVSFASDTDVRNFGVAIDQKITPKTKSVWYPEVDRQEHHNKQYRCSNRVQPAYPVYVISKGRWESRLTAKALDKIGVEYRIVVEPQEFDQYAAVIDPARILTLPFSNLGQGSIPARNWVWNHAVEAGAERHWILDDNIAGFYRFNRNQKIPITDGSVFRVPEIFADRYENVALAGLNYRFFVSQRNGDRIAPFTLNTRIYSCILIQNSLSYRWRGRYNEDTDLSLRALKDGLCTVLFNAFLIRKEPTMTMKGGNTDDLYQQDGRLKMAQSLQEQHPDVTQIVEKWGRPQHHVNYSPFRHNRLIRRAGVEVPDGPDNYGMELFQFDEQSQEWVRQS